MDTKKPAPFILSLAATGEGQPMPLGLEGLPTKNSAGQPIHYRRVPVAPFGNWTHRGNGKPIDIDKSRADQWIANTMALAAQGVKPFITPKHLYDASGEFATPDARDTLGYVERLERDDSGVYAVCALHGDDSLQVAAKNGRSVGVMQRDRRDATGTTYTGEALHHLALTPNPALPMAASADSPSIPIYTPTAAPCRKGSNMTPTIAKKARETLALSADVTDEKLDDAVGVKAVEIFEKNIALAADLVKITGERDAEKKRADAAIVERDAKAGEVLALSADKQEPDALSMSLITRSFKTDRAQVIASGVISEAGMQEVDALLMNGGRPTRTALALSAGSTDPFYSRLCAIIMKHPGIKTGNQVPRDTHEAEPVALDGDGKPKPMTPERKKEVMAMAGY